MWLVTMLLVKIFIKLQNTIQREQNANIMYFSFFFPIISLS